MWSSTGCDILYINTDLRKLYEISIFALHEYAHNNINLNAEFEVHKIQTFFLIFFFFRNRNTKFGTLKN
jgi:hypothetical protein